MRVIICLLAAIGFWFPAVSQTIVASDISENTEWNADTVHIVQTVYVYSNVTLTIKPGVVVEFEPAARLIIQGSILAQGLPSDSIHFTARDKSAGWLGVAHHYAYYQPSIYQYCSFSHAIGNWDYSYRGAALSVLTSYRVNVENSLFRNNFSQGHNIIYFSESSATFRNNTVRDNTSHGYGVFHSQSGSPEIEGNYFTRNTAAYGGAIALSYSPAIVKGNIITFNSATTYGGAIYINSSQATLTRNVIADNVSEYLAGGIYTYYSTLQMDFNTIVGNNSQQAGSGGVHAEGNGTLNIRNSILFFNRSIATRAQVSLGYGAKVALDYVNIEGGISGVLNGSGQSAADVNNFIDQDPGFADRANGNYRLGWPGFPDDYSSRSSSIDAGDPYLPRDPDGSYVDLGAFYFPQPGKLFAPRADFYADELHGYKSLKVEFFNTSVGGSNNDISYHWDFGDGESSDDANPVHEFKGIGQFDVSLTATDANGLSHTFTKAKLVTMHSRHYLSGTTTPDTLYYDGVDYIVGGTLYVPAEKRLVIEPGVRLYFQESSGLEVMGSIYAVGSATDSITFTAYDTLGFYGNPTLDLNGGWRGISITPSYDADSTIMEYCRIEYVKNGGGAAISISSTEKLRISKSLIWNNKSVNAGGGISIHGASPKINGNVIASNVAYGTYYYGSSGGGIMCDGGGNPLIVNNFIYRNQANEGGGVYVGYNVRPFLINNVISYNKATGHGGGITNHSNVRYALVQNTIINNSTTDGGALYFDYSTTRVDITNCILADNGPLNITIYGYGELGLRNCIVKGGRPSIHTYTRTNIFFYISCIDADPALATNIPVYGGRITSKSPARDKGYTVLDGLGIPVYDILGNERIKSGVIDIGAFEYTPVPPPQLLIPELTFNVKEDFEQLKIGLDSLFSFEMGTQLLLFGTNLSDAPKLVPQISGQTLTINGLADLHGADSLYVTGSNGDEEVACLVKLQIEPVNDAPAKVVTVGDLVFDQDFPTAFINLNEVFIDVDSDISGRFSLLENSVIETISAFILDDKLTFVSIPNVFGENTIEFAATDGEHTVTESIKITVREKVITGTDAGSGEMFAIFPNPTSSICQVRLPADITRSELSDSNGRILPVTAEKKDEFVIFNLDGYSPGVYFIHVFSSYHKRVLKVVKL